MGKVLLLGTVLVNISILGYFKYMNFFLENLNLIFRLSFPVENIVLPIGISFYTFQAVSYIIDVYRGQSAQKSFLKLALYISFFPQLIAGPIVKYHDIYEDLEKDSIQLEDVTEGLRRFCIGLGKKVLLANALGEVADPIFNEGCASADMSIAWLGAILYSLQLYFDFSGYSDMAIGLGRMFGFHFPENFNYPYISKSISEFWRRWHMSLGNWFREYLYIPLGGNRKGDNRTCFNLAIVFLVTGIWHGAAWTFIAWGCLHGFFVIFERVTNFTERIAKYSWISHVYAVLVFVTAWVLFRAETLTEGAGFISLMYGLRAPAELLPFGIEYYLTGKTMLLLCLAMLGATPFPSRWGSSFLHKAGRYEYVLKDIYALGLLFLSMAYIAASTYNPFIYFRF